MKEKNISASVILDGAMRTYIMKGIKHDIF